MNSTGNYIFSFILAVSLHAAVIAVLIDNWQQESNVEVTKIDRPYIVAQLVRENPLAKQKDEQVAAKEAERLRILKQMQEAEVRVNQERIIGEEYEKKLRQEAELKARLELERELAEQKANLKEMERLANLGAEIQEKARLKMEQTMFLELFDEQDYREAVTDDEKAMVFVAQIQREIIQNWSRPPSARNGMEALLKVFLVPTGEVIEVTVKDSSGNDAFDRSAILAVEKSERFEVPSDPRQFERNFREFEVLFRPEDLRL